MGSLNVKKQAGRALAFQTRLCTSFEMSQCHRVPTEMPLTWRRDHFVASMRV